jgi:hypothetical protein
MLRVLFITFTMSRDRAVVIVTNHALVDDWSFNIIKHGFIQLVGSRQRELLSPVKQFRQVVAERSPENASISRQRDYWVRQLVDVDPGLSIPTARRREDVTREVLRDQEIDVPGRSWNEVIQSARDCAKCSVTTLYVAALAATLSEYADGDVVIGNVYFSRWQAEDRDVAGLLFNVLPLRINVEGNMTVRDLIRRVNAVAIEAYLHGEIPMEDIALSLGYGQAVFGGGPPLWEAAVNVQSDSVAQPSGQALTEFDRWLHSIRAEPLMERWDGRILELIAAHDGPVLRYNSEILEHTCAATVAMKVADLLLRLPSVIDSSVRTIWK